jgi:hypothetical protein
LLTFDDFPAEHWDHLRISNPIESVFATVRHRTICHYCLHRLWSGSGSRPGLEEALRRKAIFRHLAGDDAFLSALNDIFILLTVIAQGPAPCQLVVTAR